MSFVDINFDEAVEPQPLAKGRYPTQITGAQVKQTGVNSKNPGRDQIVVTIGFTGPSKEEQNAPTMSHYISLPHPDDEVKTNNFKALQLKRFLTVYGIPFESNGIDLEQICFAMIGNEADIEVELSEPDDKGNVYNRLRLPRIQEGAVGGGRYSPPA